MPLYWPDQCVGYNLQQDAAPSVVPYDAFSTATQRAFQSWLSVDCGDGQRPGIEIYDLGAISCGATEYNQYAGNANILTFRTETWPYDDSAYTLALTTITFNTENAQIYDVDIEINAANIRITTTDEDVQYDLESILAHEIGHYFGLAHSRDKSATMYAQYQRGTLGLRTPELDDGAGICAIYPPDRVGSTCDPTPRRGLKTTCGDGSPPDEGRCTVSAPGLASSTGVPFLAFALGLILVMAARGRRSRSSQGD